MNQSTVTVLTVSLLAFVMVSLLFGNNDSQQQISQLRSNHQTLRNIEHHTRAAAKSVEAMCRDAVTPPSAC